MNETTSFDDVAAQLVPSGDVTEQKKAGAAEGLHVCRDCGSKLVHPTRWAEAGSHSWLVALRCPNCESLRIDRFDDRSIAVLEQELDRGQTELMADLGRLAHANMVDDVDRFIRALDADAIQPIDF